MFDVSAGIFNLHSPSSPSMVGTSRRDVRAAFSGATNLE
jgi:hypothetical protein